MITKYNKNDINEIIELGMIINPKFKELFNIENLLPNENLYVYKDKNELLGFLHILNNSDVIEILNIVVKEEKRNQGIASLLLDYLLSEMSPEIGRVLLEVRESNKAAINLYKKFDFFEINNRNKYYGNEDAIIMERRNNS